MNEHMRQSEVSAEHLEASARTLTELARVVSSKMAPQKGNSPLFVDLVHYEHGYFLSPSLGGFAMLPSAGGYVELPEPISTEEFPEEFAYEVLSPWAEREEVEGLRSCRASALVNPRAATEDLPFTWATVAAQPVVDQVRGVLESLSTLLARQSASPASLAALGNELPARLQAIQAEIAEVKTVLVDSVNRSGWRAAAQELRMRSEAAGHPLRVRYRPTVFDVEALAQRAPFWREVYNRLSPVRKAVDRTASALARAMYVDGPGSTDMLRMVNDHFEHFGMRQFLAHAVRDSFVCGNGVVDLSGVSASDIRLIPPESLISVHGKVATIHSEGRVEEIKPVLHLPGGRQVGSELGISFLEPFVMICAERDTFLSTLLTSELIVASRTANEGLRSWAARFKPYAQEQLKQITARTEVVLGKATQQFVDAAPGTYFEGQERMKPSAGRLALVDTLDGVTPYGRG